MHEAMSLCTCTESNRDALCPVGRRIGNHNIGGSCFQEGYTPLAEWNPPRPTWDEYFMEMAQVVAKRATCSRKHVGAIIVDHRNRIVSTGYNGSARGMPHCDDVGHELRKIDGRDSCVRTLHAESNALDDAGRRAEGGTIYVTVIPCFNCAKRIVNAGIKRVVWAEHYQSQNTDLVPAFLLKAGVSYR